MAKIIYYYDKDTFDFIRTGEAMLDPVASSIEKKEVYALPKYATFVPVPLLKDGEGAIFDKDAGKWVVIKSNKGAYKFNSRTGELSIIEDNNALRSYECVVPENLLEDFKANPIKYDIVNGELKNISKIQLYQNRYNIRKYKKLIQEAKEAYTNFRETPVEYKGMKYLPRYIDDYANLVNRNFPMEIWDCTGTKSTLMTKAEFMLLKNFLDDLDTKAYSIKKNAIRKYKKEIERLGGKND